jgi:hypothetical protein
MRKALFWIAFLCGTGMGFLVLEVVPMRRGPSASLSTQRMSQMREIGMQFRLGLYDHPELETADLKTKSIEDLVQMGILPPAAATFLGAQQAKYFGYDPEADAGTAPLFEMIYRASNGAQKRITTYADGHVTMLPVAPEKGSP